MAAQFTATKEPLRPEWAWMSRATTSLPVPDSPPIITVAPLPILPRGRLQYLHLTGKTPVLQHPVNDDLQLFGLYRLMDEVGCPLLDGLNGEFQVMLPRHHDDRLEGVIGVNLLQQLKSGAVGQLLIEQDQVEGGLLQQNDPFAAAVCRGDPEAVLLEVELQHLVEGGIVLDDQELFSHGRSIRNFRAREIICP